MPYKVLDTTIKTKNMSLGEALENLKQGKKLRRAKWDNRELYIRLVCNAVYPQLDKDNGSKLSGIMSEFIVVHTTYSYDTPWIPSQHDILENDWEIVSSHK